MLDLPRLQRIQLNPRPRFQRVIALSFLAPNYNLPPRVRITLEGLHRLPRRPVIFAMNHTDRYNYWPFQYALWRQAGRYTCVWVKGKYYEHPLMGWFMEQINSIPTISRGYVIARDVLSTLKRPPEEHTYRALRELVERVALGGDPAPPPPDVASPVLFHTPRNVLGLDFDPRREPWAIFINRLFGAMTARFVELNQEALRLGLDTIIFPQGTRSVQLSRGHSGIAQIALKFKATIVPVGCNGSERVYTSSSPWARGGDITYRIGQPIPYDDIARFHPGHDFQPLTPEVERSAGDRFQALTDLVMDRINDLLDPPYRYSQDLTSDGVAGVSRFV